MRLLDRCEAKRKEWAKHWQCNGSLQNLEDKLWKNEKLKKSEGALPRLKECGLEKVSKVYTAKTRVGVPLVVTKGNERRNRGFLGEGRAEWENGRNKLARRCSS